MRALLKGRYNCPLDLGSEVSRSALEAFRVVVVIGKILHAPKTALLSEAQVWEHILKCINPI